MSNGGIIGVGAGAASTIGRYFSVISVVPSSLYVVFVYILIQSDSWWHTPNWSHAFNSLDHLGIVGFSLLAFLSVALGVVIHPAQFAIVQFFEGYWGNTSIAQGLRYRRILHYQQKCRELTIKERDARSKLAQTGIKTPEQAQLLSRISEASRVRDNFPSAIKNIMPTRLGNTLRRAEAQAGSQYGLDALTAVPHLLMIAPAEHVDYVSDQRTQLDLAVRMTFMFALASITAIVFLWPDRFWAFIAIIPYIMAYFCYRGSIITASHYGSALDAMINLDRFDLYQRLHLKLPIGTADERAANKVLKELLHYPSEAIITYQHPGDGSS